jgi:hypothetical protein
MITVNNAGSITPPKNFKCQPECMNNKHIFLLCSNTHNICLAYSRVMESIHMAK